MTQYLYDGLNPAEELDGASPPSPTATMLTGLGIDEYFQRTDSGGTLSYLTDMPGSTLALADSGGALDTTYTYDPFGNVTVNGADTNPYQFTGRENDGTGLYYYRARYYSPTLQRFIAQDPIGFGGGNVNIYQYVHNDPLDAADSIGLCGHKPCNASLPSNPAAALLSQLIFAEATGIGITPTNSLTEMAAIAYTVINRSTFLQITGERPSYFGASDSSISGVITANQFGGLGSPRFKLAANPAQLNPADCAFLNRAIAIAQGALAGTLGDPFAEEGGVFGFRTAGSGSPGGNFSPLPPIYGSRNVFYGLSLLP